MIQTDWQGPGCHLLRMANISLANKPINHTNTSPSNFTPGAVGAVESAQAPKLTTGCRFSPMSCRLKKIWFDQKSRCNRWAKFSSVAQPIITPWPPIIKGFMPLMPLTPIIIIGCAPAPPPPPPLPNACCNVRCLFAAWSTGMSSTTDTIDALDQYWHKRPLISKMTAPHHSHMQTGIAVSRACMASMCQIHCVWVHTCFAHFFYYTYAVICQCSCFFWIL